MRSSLQPAPLLRRSPISFGPDMSTLSTPVSKVQDYEELNDYFRQCCLKKLDHRVAGKTETVAERFEQDKAAALALPDYAFDPYASSEAKVVRQPINHLS